MDSLDAWEARWAPYDETVYQAALAHVRPSDVVLDIGAGDLRFARRVAETARRVYAIELQAALLADQPPLPDNLTVFQADARTLTWPTDITVGVLLMRHCTHFRLYTRRLRQLGCRGLITNARWGMDVEYVDLGPRAAWTAAGFGWYACLCGQIGFVDAPPERITPTHMERVIEVETCPACFF